MKLLGINTSDDLLSVALVLDGAVLHEQEQCNRNHNEKVLIMIAQLMNNSNTEFAQLDGVAFGQGPGSFTGLRIAAAVAQGIAFGAQVPVVPVSCMAAIAQKQKSNKVIVALDAKRSKIFWGRYIRNEHGLMELDGEEHLTPLSDLKIPGNGWCVTGSGWDVSGENILASNKAYTVDWTRGQNPHAREIAKLGVANLALGKCQEASLAIPNYSSPYFTTPS